MDKTESENQVVHGHQQERRHDTDLDCTVCLPDDRLLEVCVKIKEIDAADSESFAHESVREMVHSRSNTWQIGRKNTHQP